MKLTNLFSFNPDTVNAYFKKVVHRGGGTQKLLEQFKKKQKKNNCHYKSFSLSIPHL